MEFNSIDTTFKKIIEAKTFYKIPPYQRDYSWDEEQWQDLWDNLIEIYEALSNEKSHANGFFKKIHYMGAIVFQVPSNPHLMMSSSDECIVVDGQQRIVTLSIILIVSAKIMEDMCLLISPSKERNDFEKDVIELKDLLTVRGELSKLKLNIANASYYENNIFNHNIHKKSLESTNQLLRGCYEFFYKAINEYFLKKEKPYKEIMHFVNSIKSCIQFIQIIVSTEEQAFSIFETINATGNHLSVTDLLKNHFFAKASGSSSENNVHGLWIKIMENVQYDVFPVFLRAFLSCFHQSPKKDRMYRVIKTEYKTPESIKKLMNDLEKCSKFYASLKDDNNYIKNLYDASCQEYIVSFRLLGVTQVHPVLIAMHMEWDTFKLEKFKNVTKMLLHAIVRYYICRRSPSGLEPYLNKMAVDIAKGSLKSVTEIKRSIINGFYVHDEEFSEAFLRLSISQKEHNKAKYILTEIEKFIASQKGAYNKHSPKDADLSVEHILPKSSNLKNDDGEQVALMIGNLTIMSSKKNSKFKDKGYAEKVTYFKSSSFHIDKDISGFKKWDKDAINSRQKNLLKYAKQVWSIN